MAKLIGEPRGRARELNITISAGRSRVFPSYIYIYSATHSVLYATRAWPRDRDE